MATISTEASSNTDESLSQVLLQAAQTWSKFDLTLRRPLLERSAQTCREQREASQTARKSLADTTKSFRKSVKAAAEQNEEFANECRSTIKSYQEEVDNLTRRCKSSDSNFLDLQKVLCDLPDPFPVLQQTMEELDNKRNQISHLLKGMEVMNGEMVDLEQRHKGEVGELSRTIQELRRELESEPINVAALQENVLALSLSEKKRDAEFALGGGGMSKADREELMQLRKEVAEYEAEFRGLKNQDITIRKLEAKIAEMQKSSEEEMQAELRKAQEDLAQTEGRRAAEALEREAVMERRVQSLELELRAERAGRESTQAHLFEADEGASQREATWEAQRQILMDDSDRLREVLHAVSRERDELNLRVSAIMDGGGSGVKTAIDDLAPMRTMELLAERKAYEAEVTELTLTATLLKDTLRNKEESFSEMQRSMQATIQALENERENALSKVSFLEAEIASAPSKQSIENMRRELRILKRLEYNAVDADAERDPEMTTGGNEIEEGNLESVLVAKLRKVDADLVRERRERGEIASECQRLQLEYAALAKAKSEADELAIRLEADLASAIVSTSLLTSDNFSRQTDIPFSGKSDPDALQRILDPSTPLSPPDTVTPTKSRAELASDKANDDHSVATIVMAQRDRLRARCDALEAERDSFKRELQAQVSTAESLKADNTKLYEKVRYLQSYAGSSTGVYGGKSLSHQSDRDLDLEALEQRYEASVDPFRQFSRAERQRKMNEMSPMERVVFHVAKTVLGSKEMRTVLFFYVLGLHLLVFITTYHWSHELGCQDIHLHQDLAHFHGGVPLPDVPNNTASAATTAGE